jgi:hypothetical protein
LLLAHGADLAMASDSGQTALSLAAEKGYGEAVQLLQGAERRL